MERARGKEWKDKREEEREKRRNTERATCKTSAKMQHIQRALFPFCVIYFTCTHTHTYTTIRTHTRTQSGPAHWLAEVNPATCYLALGKTNSVRVYTQNQTLKDSSAPAPAPAAATAPHFCSLPLRCCQALHMHPYIHTHTHWQLHPLEYAVQWK